MTRTPFPYIIAAMSEQLFEVVRFNRGRMLKYSEASFPQDRALKADIYLSPEMFGRLEAGYACMVPRFRPQWPTPQEFADEALNDVVRRGWTKGQIPQEVRDLLATTRVAVLSAHGNIHPKKGWYAHIERGIRIPVQTLVEKHLLGYETIILGVCNPTGESILPIRGTVIYPVSSFGIPDETEMIIKKGS